MDIMNASAYVNQGFDTMRPILAAFVGQEMQRSVGDNWWRDAVLPKLSEVYTRNLPQSGKWIELVDSLDVMACFQLIDRNWIDLFKYKMTTQQRNWVKELQSTRNEWAHSTGNGFSDDDASRALDTMARLMEPIDQEVAEELRKLMRQVRYKTNGGASTEAPTTPVASVPAPISSHAYARPWRQIAEPHPDVAQGKYRQAEFAADLSQVLRGTAMPEYQDPVEFYARTYITDGMRGMLVKAALRVAGKGGEPVIQLKTAFGGGKTHSMLALYHMMRAVSPSSLSGIPQILKDTDITSMPKVTVAVLVGTSLDPTKQRRPINFPGITINTLWGEMAAQLAEQSGNAKLYDYVKEADKKGISPGSNTLRELFDACAPCMILIDELVAYARKLYGYKQGEVPAGTFENVLSFVQELTEAARASKNSIVVASIPESETETGGEAGNLALQRIEHTFGRMEAVWKPVVAEEGFEIVRRRLFRDITDQAIVNQICNTYSELYRSNPDEFPVECREADYLNKMKKCYPIHPEVFDRLYNDWATMESFQRTRGVLRFMAAVIHNLYINNDGGTMIMPGSIAFSKSEIRYELLRDELSRSWDAIIDKEIDGRHSIPTSLDGKNQHYGRFMACSRITRTIFLGSAPEVREQRNRGIGAMQIRLGVVQPGENLPTYNDALSKLAGELTYLYSSADNRYWFDTRPTLRKTVADRARMQSNDEIMFELEKVLKSVCRNKDPFDAVHIAPGSSGDVPDQQSTRLVLLTLKQTYKQNEKCEALAAVGEYLELRGTAPRMYRNMVTFLAPDSSAVNQLSQDMRTLMAWRSIDRDTESLNLDNAQKKEVKEAIKRYDDMVNDRIQDAYSWLLMPSQLGTSPVSWSAFQVAGKNPVSKAAQKMREDEYLIHALSPRILSMEMEQYKLWKDQEAIPVRELWEDYTRYLYLHRLVGYNVLLETLESGIKSGEFFGYADGQDAFGRYQNLCYGSKGYLHITQDGLIVRREVAELQIEKENAARATQAIDNIESGTAGQPFPEQAGANTQPEHTAKKNTHFYASIQIDANKLGSTAGTISQEVLRHLNKLPGVEVTVILDIQASIPDGVPDDEARTIRENCGTLKFQTSEFDEE